MGERGIVASRGRPYVDVEEQLLVAIALEVDGGAGVALFGGEERLEAVLGVLVEAGYLVDVEVLEEGVLCARGQRDERDGTAKRPTSSLVVAMVDE